MKISWNWYRKLLYNRVGWQLHHMPYQLIDFSFFGVPRNGTTEKMWYMFFSLTIEDETEMIHTVQLLIVNKAEFELMP